MSTSTTTRALTVRRASLDRMREHLAIHEQSAGITRPSPRLVAQERHAAAALARDLRATIFTALRTDGRLTDTELADRTGGPVSDLLDAMVEEGTLSMSSTAAGDTYWIA